MAASFLASPPHSVLVTPSAGNAPSSPGPPGTLFLIEVQLIYNIVLVSGVQQSDSVIHTYICIYLYSFFLFFSVIVYYKILNTIPCAVQ